MTNDGSHVDTAGGRAFHVEDVESDLTVIGGGLAGVCAAIAAARLGTRVALVQNRPVLGGNSSSEIRVWVCGATAHGVQHYARETGIMGEFFLENQFVNADGNPYYWDLVLLEAVRAEPNVTLYLNTDVRVVDATGDEATRVIRSATGWQIGSERVLRFRSPMFIDCSGDGVLGYLAGAQYRVGREARHEFEEPWAPEEPDTNLLGSTILFYSKDVGHHVKFIPPSFALDIAKTAIPDNRIIHEESQGCAYWWIEWGGHLDIVRDSEAIRDELQAVVYGIWDYIKNSGRFPADNLTLEWIGSTPGKREYRRFLGDYVLTQNDIIEQTVFEDRVAFGGWSIDLHPAGGVYATEQGAYHWHPDGTYHLPLRSLYSANVANMWMAGRNISATHVAFGGTRVMATCATLGEAAGTAAAVALRLGCTPRELYRSHLVPLQHALVRADASTLGIRHTDPADLALHATATASSTLREILVEAPESALSLQQALGFVLPVDPSLGTLEVLMDVLTDTTLEAEIYAPSRPQNYVPGNLVKSVRVRLERGPRQWVSIPVDWTPAEPQNAFIVLRENPSITLYEGDHALPGTLFFTHRSPGKDDVNSLHFREWKHFLKRKSICYRLRTPTNAFHAGHVIGGYARPYGGPQMWVSHPVNEDPQPWINLTWPDAVSFDEVVLLFDDEVEEDLINLHHHRTPFEVLPALARDYELSVCDEGDWKRIVEVRGNRQRRRQHELPAGIRTSQLRLRILATNGAPRAHVVAMRAYSNRGDVRS